MSDLIEPMTCSQCDYFSEFKEPRKQKNKDGIEYTIYGYCFKSFFQPDYNKGYAVFIPEGACKQFKKHRRSNSKNGGV